MEIKNAMIEDVSLTSDGHGLLTAYLHLTFGGYNQGFGGYALYLPKSFKHHNKSAGYAGHFIWRVMEIAGVSSWDKLKGKTIRVESNMSKIHRIGHIIKDDWFCPEEDFKE